MAKYKEKEIVENAPLPPERRILPIGLPLGCDKCVLPAGYAGADFVEEKSGKTICNFCKDHVEPIFLGEDQFIYDLGLQEGEQIGVTVSGGKDSMYAWMWLV